MDYIVRIYFNDMIFSADLSMQPKVTVGSDRNDSICLDAAELKKNHVTFSRKGSGIVIKGKNMYNHNGSRISSEYIEAGNRYRIDTVPKIHLSIHPKQENASQIVNLDSITEIGIGRDDKNDIVLKNNRTSSFHCKIFKAEEGLRIRDNGSKNGTFVNGKQVFETVLRNRDIINISIYQMEYSNGKLVFYNVGNDMKIQNERIIYSPEPDYDYYTDRTAERTEPLYDSGFGGASPTDRLNGAPSAWQTGTPPKWQNSTSSAWQNNGQPAGWGQSSGGGDEKDFFEDPYRSKTDETKGFF